MDAEHTLGVGICKRSYQIIFKSTLTTNCSSAKCTISIWILYPHTYKHCKLVHEVRNKMLLLSRHFVPVCCTER